MACSLILPQGKLNRDRSKRDIAAFSSPSNGFEEPANRSDEDAGPYESHLFYSFEEDLSRVLLTIFSGRAYCWTSWGAADLVQLQSALDKLPLQITE